MAPTLLSPAAVNHHPSVLTATNSFLPSFDCSTSIIISSHRWPHGNSKSWRGRCGVVSPRPPPPPEDSEPPPEDDDDQSSNSGSVAALSRFQDGVQIFCAVFFWMSLFFWSSVWDGRNNGRSNKGPRFWK